MTDSSRFLYLSLSLSAIVQFEALNLKSRGITNQTDLIKPEKIKEIINKNDLDEKEAADIVLEVVDESN